MPYNLTNQPTTMSVHIAKQIFNIDSNLQPWNDWPVIYFFSHVN